MTSLRNLISTVCLSMAFLACAQAPVVSFRIEGAPSGATMSLALRPVGNNEPKATSTLSATAHPRLD
ncbi:MAG: hypothetical protein K2K72_04515, partial [Duncaniella sp.]|nr:hypothetical protein [Duncaniella sp.]